MTRFGQRHDNMSIRSSEVRPLSKCVRPKHDIKVEIRPGLTVYTDDKKKIPYILEKYRGK